MCVVLARVGMQHVLMLAPDDVLVIQEGEHSLALCVCGALRAKMQAVLMRLRPTGRIAGPTRARTEASEDDDDDEHPRGGAARAAHDALTERRKSCNLQKGRRARGVSRPPGAGKLPAWMRGGQLCCRSFCPRRQVQRRGLLRGALLVFVYFCSK